MKFDKVLKEALWKSLDKVANMATKNPLKTNAIKKNKKIRK